MDVPRLRPFCRGLGGLLWGLDVASGEGGQGSWLAGEIGPEAVPSDPRPWGGDRMREEREGRKTGED